MNHWSGIFSKVLRGEDLFALNALAATFPPLEEYDKYCAVIESADVNVRKDYIALTKILDDFDYYPLRQRFG